MAGLTAAAIGKEVGKEIIKRVASAFLSSLLGKDEEAEARAKFRAEMINGIRRLHEEMIQQRFNEIRSSILGLERIYRSYTPKRNDYAEKNRLVELIDDAAKIIAAIENEFFNAQAQIKGQKEFGLSVAPYAAIVFLRAQAQIERQVVYGDDVKKDIIVTFNDGIENLTKFIAYAKKASHRISGSSYEIDWDNEEYGGWFCAYEYEIQVGDKFISKKTDCGSFGPESDHEFVDSVCDHDIELTQNFLYNEQNGPILEATLEEFKNAVSEITELGLAH